MSHLIDVVHNAINAADLKKVKAPKDPKNLADQNEHGLRVYDPGFSNTAVSESKITYMSVNRARFQKISK